jgi:hypothetical protein
LKVFSEKTYRCEWQIYAHRLGQFDEYTEESDDIVYESFPTYAEAKENEAKYLKVLNGGRRKVPIDANGGHWHCGVRYMEVFIHDT